MAVIEEVLSDEPSVSSTQALKLKDQGNGEFRNKSYAAALELYSEAISLLMGDNTGVTDESVEKPPTMDSSDRGETIPQSPLFPKSSLLQAVLLTNRGTCRFHLNDNQACIDDCSAAIAIDPSYGKAYYRRGLAYERLGDLGAAYDDLEKAPRDLYPSNALSLLKQRRDAKFEKDKAEVLNSLKDLGNSILGKFGMSTDDFKFEKDPQTGSYSINMKNRSGSSARE